MSRKSEIQNAYKYLGKEATFYDGMITCSTLSGKAVCKAVWNMGREKNTRYLEMAMAGIPDDFSGKMLEVPVGTGVLTMPVYKTLPLMDRKIERRKKDIFGSLPPSFGTNQTTNIFRQQSIVILEKSLFFDLQ